MTKKTTKKPKPVLKHVNQDEELERFRQERARQAAMEEFIASVNAQQASKLDRGAEPAEAARRSAASKAEKLAKHCSGSVDITEAKRQFLNERGPLLERELLAHRELVENAELYDLSTDAVAASERAIEELTAALEVLDELEQE